ncbi:MAG: biopolymer transporter ExbD [Lentisphaeria bacterium]|jgi:biopolymer transport protein ExbD|nr:biopolymer transporter ExbD [Lentisphaerota bacterium]MBO5644188.1 biopolymer transporter ExbD [Lentisphaeria bacterium]MBO5765844.1 biopolymer transporter ExbD [Lentisphaeria bacterium]MBO5990814.1 biopolymer transporter ExbD [Lentisphaeria bacterium]MBO7154142.1 biopolymer transporter ExbD [Lentisphaeria bacterium]
MRRKRRRFQAETFDRIDVTPLLDLTFLLLIAFMITMPLMEYGTSIKAPKMNSDKLPENNFKSITITAKGTIMFDKEAVTKEQLVEKLSQLKASGSKNELLLRADGSRSYRDVIELMALIRNCGFADVILVTQPEDKQ